jgi:carboxyl-terminal processing protease
MNKDLTFFDLTYNRLMKRMKDKGLYKLFLSSPLTIQLTSFNTDYEKKHLTQNVAELKERWRKQIKLSTLSSLTDRLKIQEDRRKGVVNAVATDSLLSQN